jgi:hypothetical protein
MSPRPVFLQALRPAAMIRCRAVGKGGSVARKGSGANSYGWK